MHLLSYTWALLPILVSTAIAQIPPPSSVSLEAGNVESIRLDKDRVQASFIVPCTNCLGSDGGSFTDHSFLFDIQAFSSEEPCASSNLNLNGVPFAIRSAGTVDEQSASVNSSGHELELLISTDCLYSGALPSDSTSAAALLLTVRIVKVDRYQLPYSVSAGFTLSIKRFNLPDLLRFSRNSDYQAHQVAHQEDWRFPVGLQFHPSPAVSFDSEVSIAHSLAKPTVEKEVEDLRELERQVAALEKLIRDKKGTIDSLSQQEATRLKEEIRACDSTTCVLQVLVQRLRKLSKKLCLNLSKAKQAFTHLWTSHLQSPTTMKASQDDDGLPRQPEACHCSDGKAKDVPPAYAESFDRRPGGKIGQDRCLHADSTNASAHYASDEPQWRSANQPSHLSMFLKTLFVVTGLAFICSFIHRRCMSLRKRADRAADRERRTAERLYRQSARRQAWRDWWSGRTRQQPLRRTGDYDEKRALIIQQEGVLEQVMQDDIQQLEIEEQIRQLRSTRDAVEDLVRAEEGRAGGGRSYPGYSHSAGNTTNNPFNRHHPSPITIPDSAWRMYPSSAAQPSSYPLFRPSSHSPLHYPAPISSDDDDTPSRPFSRSSSLPEYKTDASSEPPSYDDDMVADGFSDYTPSIGTHASHWSPGSSIPDISTRPSIETARTFL